MNRSSKATVQWAGTCYSVDLQAGKLVVVRAERAPWPTLAGRGPVNYTTVSPDDPCFREGIQSGTVSVGCLSARESFTCWLEAPFPAFSKAQKVFPTLLDIQLPFALEDCVCCFLNASRTQKNTVRTLAVAARLADVEKKLESFKTLGIDPIALDHEGLALWTQSLRELPVPPDDRNLPRVVISLDEDHSTLVVGRGEEFLAAHSIRHENTDQISRLLRAELGSPLDSITPNAQRSTLNVQHSTPNSAIKWFWTGPGARDSGLVKALLGRLNRDWPGSSVVHDDPGTFLARALATRALLPGPLRCNLRTGRLTHPGIIQRARRQSVKTALLFLLAGLLLCGVNFTWARLVGRKEAQIDLAFSSLADDLAGYHITAKGEHALDVVSRQVDKQVELLRPFLNAFEPSLMGTISAIMEIGRKNDLRYQMLSLSRDKVLISGTAGDWNRCEKLSAYLEQEGFAVKLDRKEALADERVLFTITSGGTNE